MPKNVDKTIKKFGLYRVIQIRIESDSFSESDQWDLSKYMKKYGLWICSGEQTMRGVYYIHIDFTKVGSPQAAYDKASLAIEEYNQSVQRKRDE